MIPISCKHGSGDPAASRRSSPIAVRIQAVEMLNAPRIDRNPCDKFTALAPSRKQVSYPLCWKIALGVLR